MGSRLSLDEHPDEPPLKRRGSAATADERVTAGGLVAPRRAATALPDAAGAVTTNPRRIYILPSAAGWAFAAMLLATLLGSLNYQNNLGLFFCFLMAAVAFVSMHHCWFNLLGLRIAARDANPVFCGQTARFAVVLTEGRGRSRGSICLAGGRCTGLPPGGRRQLNLELATHRRGEQPLGAVTIDTRHPLGLFRSWSRVPTKARVLVYPRPAALAPQPPLHHQAFEHNAGGDGGSGADDFIGPRAYRPGDPPRRLDWKAMARERGLVVKQFGGDRAARLRLDWHQHRGSAEQRLALLTRQVLEAHERRLSFGLSLPGSFIERGRGEVHKHRCLEALAQFDLEDAAPNVKRGSAQRRHGVADA